MGTPDSRRPPIIYDNDYGNDYKLRKKCNDKGNDKSEAETSTDSEDAALNEIEGDNDQNNDYISG